jgi:exosortase
MLLKPTRLFNPIYFQICILLAVFMGLYFTVILTMVRDWDVDANYSHGYFIPFLSAFMIYTKRREIQSLDISRSNWGLPFILIGLIQLTLAKIGSEYFLQRTSMILVLFGISLFVMGKTLTKKISFPILYLIFMVPIPAIIWNKFAFPMQLFSSSLTEWVIQMMRIPVFREGNILHLGETSLEVVNACSGLRALISMLTLSAAFAYLSSYSRAKKWILFLSAAPIAILVNIIRLTFTAVLANQFGESTAQGFLHDFSGWAIFLVGLAMLFGVNLVLSKGEICRKSTK